jgi:signal transduction histidine kinase
MKNIIDRILPSREFYLSLRIKITLIFILPVIALIAVLLYLHIKDEREELQSMAETSATQMADVTLAGLKHTMLNNDMEMEHSLVHEICSYSLIRDIRVITSKMQVHVSSDNSEVGKTYELSQSGCVECHQIPPDERPHSVRLHMNGDILRVVITIANEPECQTCHSANQSHLGVLQVDTPMEATEQKIREHTISSLWISMVAVLGVIALSFLLVEWLVIRRVDVIRSALLNFGKQDFSTRIQQKWHSNDELTQLGNYFNQIASDLETLQLQKKEKERVRALSIIEERERIARELHDGVAQFLAYLSAKVGAIRVELMNKKFDVASDHLQQVEESVREQSIEVRSSILGLKMAGNVDKGFLHNVSEFVDYCNRLDDLVIEMEVLGNLNDLHLGAETELQLIRILQESVSNIRKHARATEALVRLEVQPEQFVMKVSDNGVGFNLLETGMDHVGHFGLQIIVERAREIGAQAEIKSAPNEGTQVIITMNLSEK